ncbi:MAG TPA: hypothetical protein VFZ40_18530 [Pyrinomonadaceae bacterium]
MKTNPVFGALLLAFVAICAMCQPAAAFVSDESSARATIQSVFDQLKSGNYAALYDSLPSSSRSRITKDRFVNGLQRTSNLYQLQRIEIGAVRVSGDLAVADTTMYARVNKPLNADGKLVVQQYLVREDGQWRVATGDNATIKRFLKANPSFARRFPIRSPKAYINQNGKWVEIPMGRR